MKTRSLLYLFLSLGFWTACTPDESEVLDFNKVDVAKIELGADARQLIADGIATLTLNPILYQECTYQDKDGKDSVGYGRIPTDRLKDVVRYFLEDGTELEGAEYRTTDLAQGNVGFYITVNDMKSDVFTVALREPFADDKYETITYPVVFHVVQATENVTAGQSIGADLIYEVFNTMSKIFAREVAVAPNGADTRIRFQLAEYDPNGKKMQERGINRFSERSEDLNNYLLKNLESELKGYYSKYILWDYKKYLNIWIIEGVGASIAAPPTYILAGTEPLDGVFMIGKSEADFENVNWKVSDIGLLFDAFQFKTGDGLQFGHVGLMGSFFGLKPTENMDSQNVTSDYCDDTVPYRIYTESWYDQNGADANSRLKITDDGLLFYSTNIMDYGSFRSSITMDQVKRMRIITDNCPLRWSWKSKWAFTGKED